MLALRTEIPVEVHGGGRFVTADHVPAYLKTFEEGRLKEKVDEALERLRLCTLCPRNCRVDRWSNRFAVCRVGRYSRVSAAFAHFGEEDVLRGWRGSGTIFFSWCNLRCVFCQNFQTSQVGEGEEVTAKELAGLMIKLQEMGCHNINFVTPEHVVPQVLEALPYSIEMGLRVPLVYNTSSYDSEDSLQLMEGVVDVYMPDFKLWDREHARKYLLAPDYPECARRIIQIMHQQVGELFVDEQGLARRGVLVRHLVMPGMGEDTEAILSFVASLSQDTYVNVMDQYYPTWKASTAEKYAEINRRITIEEFDRALSYARQAGLWRLDTRWRSIKRPLFFLE